VAISYTTSPIHSLEKYVELVEQIEALGATSICIKDMAGVMTPREAYELVSALRAVTKLPLHLHTHATTGMGFMTLLKAVEAGINGIDTAISAFSGGTSQPATETMVCVLEESGYQSGTDAAALKRINDFFLPLHQRYIREGLIDPYVLGTRTDALNYKIPGGMLSNLISQLKGLGSMERFAEVLQEVPRVREDLGYPPLVTPMSQMVGVQAVQNVLTGRRYGRVSKEMKAYMLGEYGRPPGPIRPDLLTAVLGDEQPVKGRYADSLAPGLEAGRREIGDLAKSEEDVLSYILFPQIAETFLREREERARNTVRYTIEKMEDE
jgi:oxaloacetate decarboxylase alpha subunit